MSASATAAAVKAAAAPALTAAVKAAANSGVAQTAAVKAAANSEAAQTVAEQAVAVASKIDITAVIGNQATRASLGCQQGAQAEDSQVDERAMHQKQCRDAQWDLVHDAASSTDCKEYTKCKKRRAKMSKTHLDLLHAVGDNGDQLAEVTDLIRSAHPGRALPGTNPIRLAFALQPAVEQGLLTQQ